MNMILPLCLLLSLHFLRFQDSDAFSYAHSLNHTTQCFLDPLGALRGNCPDEADLLGVKS